MRKQCPKYRKWLEMKGKDISSNSQGQVRIAQEANELSCNVLTVRNRKANFSKAWVLDWVLLSYVTKHELI